MSVLTCFSDIDNLGELQVLLTSEHNRSDCLLYIYSILGRFMHGQEGRGGDKYVLKKRAQVP